MHDKYISIFEFYRVTGESDHSLDIVFSIFIDMGSDDDHISSFWVADMYGKIREESSLELRDEVLIRRVSTI